MAEHCAFLSYERTFDTPPLQVGSRLSIGRIAVTFPPSRLEVLAEHKSYGMFLIFHFSNPGIAKKRRISLINLLCQLEQHWNKAIVPTKCFDKFAFCRAKLVATCDFKKCMPKSVD